MLSKAIEVCKAEFENEDGSARLVEGLRAFFKTPDDFVSLVEFEGPCLSIKNALES